MKQRKLAIVSKECVACGNCVRYCRAQAIIINKGICAVVDVQKCVGCGKCAKACPAGIITIAERESNHELEKVV